MGLCWNVETMHNLYVFQNLILDSVVGAGMQPHPLAKSFGKKLVRFGQIWLDLV